MWGRSPLIEMVISCSWLSIGSSTTVLPPVWWSVDNRFTFCDWTAWLTNFNTWTQTNKQIHVHKQKNKTNKQIKKISFVEVGSIWSWDQYGKVAFTFLRKRRLDLATSEEYIWNFRLFPTFTLQSDVANDEPQSAFVELYLHQYEQVRNLTKTANF